MEWYLFGWITGKVNKKSPQVPKHLGARMYLARLADDGDAGGLGALGALLYGKFYALAFFKVAVTFAHDRGEVNENILAAFTLDEAVAFASVKPLYRSGDSF